MDSNTKEVLFEKNAHTKKLTASICKVLTAYTALKYLKLDNYIIVNEQMVNVEGSKIYLEVGDIVSIETLLYGLMLRSGNDAATALALAYSSNIEDFVYQMNQIVKSLNLKNSFFENPSGLDGVTNNYSTCYDLAYIMSVALKNETFRKIISAKTYNDTLPNGKKIYFYNKHRMIHSDSNVIGGKTGYTKKAGRTLITVFNQNGRELIVITMDAYNDWNLHRMLVQNYDE
ncbi:MAG: D-alanyl-D-alanine carboxypeptidase [Bacilli bacterium]|nr:D-alanyl-D-alanine carboxypeptidase [Bacilli bacterium]